MAKTTKMNLENVKPDVAGALQVIRAKKSREQIKTERFLPFVDVIDAALAADWSWSAIVKLIREKGGPSLTKKDAEALYAQIKGNAETGEGVTAPVNTPPNAQQASAKGEVTE